MIPRLAQTGIASPIITYYCSTRLDSTLLFIYTLLPYTLDGPCLSFSSSSPFLVLVVFPIQDLNATCLDLVRGFQPERDRDIIRATVDSLV